MKVATTHGKYINICWKVVAINGMGKLSLPMVKILINWEVVAVRANELN
jgi:hypothetical protein